MRNFKILAAFAALASFVSVPLAMAADGTTLGGGAATQDTGGANKTSSGMAKGEAGMAKAGASSDSAGRRGAGSGSGTTLAGGQKSNKQ